MLCEAGGEVVSHGQLIEGVWHGRALSENSVAVVIGQLRKALGDDAREPKLIETIPKRGYRLRDTRGERRTLDKQRALLLMALIAAAATLGIAELVFAGRGSSPIVVADVVNETGNRTYDALARATSELIITDLGQRGFAVRRSGAGDLRLASKLVMWDGAPYLGMTATDRGGVVRWSAMIEATEGKVPPGVAAELDGLAREVRGKEGGQRLAEPQGHR